MHAEDYHLFTCVKTQQHHTCMGMKMLGTGCETFCHNVIGLQPVTAALIVAGVCRLDCQTGQHF